MNNDAFLKFLKQLEKGKISDHEINLLNDWFTTFSDDADIYTFQENEREAVTADMWDSFRKSIKTNTGINPNDNKIRHIIFKRAAVAAIFLAACLSVTMYILRQDHPENKIKAVAADNIAVPGGTGAVLTLANGRTISLDSNNAGTVAQQAGVTIINGKGQLSYINNHSSGNAVDYNTLSTPKGREYRLVLPDGSIVWLNAESTIRFPTEFTGKERTVEMTGEAYFEVVHNSAVPFKVLVNDSIQLFDIGTKFDIYAYNDEKVVKTTLLEGSLKIANGKVVKSLHPDEQARITAGIANITISKPEDAKDAIAWKNGLINFEMVDIPSLLRQISRWYNVKIIYSGNPPQGHISGSISKQLDLPDVIKILSMNKINCRLERDTIYVDP